MPNDWSGEVVASAARTTTGNSGTLDNFGAEQMSLAVDVTAASGTTPTLDVTVEWSTDNGVTWFAGQPADSFTQITVATKVNKQFDPKAKNYRVVWTIGGTTPSFTFAVDAFLEQIG